MKLVLMLASCALTSALHMNMALRPATLSATVTRAPALTMQFGKKKKEAPPTLAERGYWEGEWVCADCGYIYEPGTEPPFEELRSFWKCPQCAGPRRRFVKKAGGVTGQLDDTPLVVGTAACAIFIAWAVYYALVA